MTLQEMFAIHPLPWAPDPKAGGILRDANGVVLARFEARDKWESVDATNDMMCTLTAAAVNRYLNKEPTQPSIDDLQRLVVDWANRKFPGRSTAGMSFKLLEEAVELGAAIHRINLDRAAKELADVLIVALDIADAWQIDLPAAIRDKMAINEQREWKTDEDGTAHHVKTR